VDPHHFDADLDAGFFWCESCYRFGSDFSAYHYNADPDPDFYLMLIRIQDTKMLRIHADPDQQHLL
jgi:hypothetical protein